ncbi:MAG: primosomal protein N' [Alkalispirochaeta sp.]
MNRQRTVEVVVPVPVAGSFTYLVPESAGTVPFGVRVIVPFGRRTVTGIVIRGAEDPEEPERGGDDGTHGGIHRDETGDDGIPGSAASFDAAHSRERVLKEISRVLDDAPLMDPEFLELARWVSETYLSPLGEVLASMLPSARRGKELPELTGDEPEIAPDRIVLSDEQEAAIGRLGNPQEGEEWFYLYGITGSGKTEVFLRAAEETLRRGKSVLYLVPEIALTHQLFDHISRRFGSGTAMLHSGLTPSQRLGEWHRILRGDARLVVGARSAVFAPVRDLGLVVVDEEHEGSYKAGNTPRYHARQVAMWRARRARAVCVMGSATPSVEAWHLMGEGRLVRLDLTRRLSGGALPRVEVENVRGSGTLISPRLKQALRDTHAAGAQSILFLNRRGYAGVFQCRSCGYQSECPHCSVPMTYHKQQGRMVCHYCGYRTRPMSVCPECGSLDVGYTGFGTERIEEDLKRELPELRVARLDTDVTARRGALGELLDRFAAGEIDVMLGTQMVAKGLNFPRVRTVGIVMADTGLSLPDFRAAERTFALIVQVAGRAGRFRKDGEVIVQTLRPEHPAIRRAVSMDIDRFYREELAVRRDLHFPPFARLLRLVVRSATRGDAEGVAREIAGTVHAAIASRGWEETVSVLGPAPAPLERINRNWRVQLILRSGDVRRLNALASIVTDEGIRRSGVYIEIDVDPIQLL